VLNKQIEDRDQVLANTIQTIPLSPGTYALVYRCDAPFQAVAGKLGPVCLSPGHWIYIGSAFGAGGLKSRLRHHLKPSPRPHWHLDYIKHGLKPVEIWLTTDGVKQEHAWATVMSGLKGATCPIAGFGASDCTCRSHLIHLRRRPGFTGFNKRIRKTFTHGLMRIPCPSGQTITSHN
jgi:Uri superfamily endonuclease